MLRRRPHRRLNLLNVKRSGCHWHGERLADLPAQLLVVALTRPGATVRAFVDPALSRLSATYLTAKLLGYLLLQRIIPGTNTLLRQLGGLVCAQLKHLRLTCENDSALIRP